MPHEELFKDMDEVASQIIVAEAWHAKAANECFGLGVRGWGKWHQAESMIHKKCLDKLNKKLQDRLDFTPQPNPKPLMKVNQFEINNLDEFIQHHFEWIDREKQFNEMLKNPLKASKTINRELHEQLEKLEEEAQYQMYLVKKVYKRIEFAGFMPHDIGVVSKWIEDYFDYEYVPHKRISFNIG